MMRTISLDTEFFNSNEKNMTIVAAVICEDKHTYKYNLFDKRDVLSFKTFLNGLGKEDIILAYAAIAEARSLMSLGIDPLQFNWIDLYVEFRMLCNSNNQYNFGTYIPKSGGTGFSTPPDPTMSDEDKMEDKETHEETPKNLINAVFKLLKVRLDAEEKDAMRDLILSKDLVKIHAHMEDILDYCASDTKYLRALDIAIQRALEKEGINDFRPDQLDRGKYAVAVSCSECIGMPINLPLLERIIKKTPEILNTHKGSVNEYFPFFVPDFQRPSILRKNGTHFHYKPTAAHKDMSAYQTYVEGLAIKDFPQTRTGKYKSDKETLDTYGYWAGLEALWKHNQTEASLKWFNKENGNGFFERMGSDNCIRPYFGIFGTQTGRNAAKAKTFPLAMSSWLRAIVQPPKGMFIVGADFSQQEVYVAAILSNDRNLLDAYLSGDVYLAFAKQAGIVPSSATKASHKAERDLCKSTVLGLQFGMGIAKLHMKLKLDNGKEVSLEKTQELITAHKTVFSTYWQWVYGVTNEYKAGNPLSTNDGWILFNDNPSIPSVRNFLVQGNAASITRRAITKMTAVGMQVLCGLHDAVYCLTDDPERCEQHMAIHMLEATREILKEDKTNIRLDFKTVTHEEHWVDDKGKAEWKKLKEFLLPECIE